MNQPTIAATCLNCGDVRLSAEQVTLRRRPEPRFSFTCPGCGQAVSREATGLQVRLLESGGVRDRGVVSGPPFTADDLLALHWLLDTPDWFDQLLAVTS